MAACFRRSDTIMCSGCSTRAAAEGHKITTFRAESAEMMALGWWTYLGWLVYKHVYMYIRICLYIYICICIENRIWDGVWVYHQYGIYPFKFISFRYTPRLSAIGMTSHGWNSGPVSSDFFLLRISENAVPKNHALSQKKWLRYPYDPCMLYMVIFTINIPPLC